MNCGVLVSYKEIIRAIDQKSVIQNDIDYSVQMSEPFHSKNNGAGLLAGVTRCELSAAILFKHIDLYPIT